MLASTGIARTPGLMSDYRWLAQPTPLTTQAHPRSAGSQKVRKHRARLRRSEDRRVNVRHEFHPVNRGDIFFHLAGKAAETTPMDCPVCLSDEKVITPGIYKGLVVACPRCGGFRVMGSAVVELGQPKTEKRLEALSKLAKDHQEAGLQSLPIASDSRSKKLSVSWRERAAIRLGR